MPLKLLPHKSWHVYNQENVARVKRDEAQAALEQEQHDDRAFRADAEARLDRLRNKQSRKRRRTDDGDDDAEQALQRQLAGKGTRRDDDEDQGGSHANAVIVRPEGWTASGKKDSDATTAAASMTTNGHLNFWAELEAVRTPLLPARFKRRVADDFADLGKQGAQGPTTTTTTLEKRLDKVLAQEQPDSLTKVYLAKKGEGEPRGWYASPDGKTDRERKEPVEKTLERTCVFFFRFRVRFHPSVLPSFSSPSTVRD